MVRILGVSALISTLMGLADARADPTPPAREPDRERARGLFDESRRLYKDGRFEEAARLLEEAYRLDPAPTLLYNLARARENGGDLEGAVEAYERYLAEDPRAEDRAAIVRRVENLKSQLKERADLAALAARKSKPPEAYLGARPPPSPSPLPWVLAGVGAAGAGAGLVFGLLAKSRHDGAAEAPNQMRADALASQAGGLATAANIAYAAGGVLAISGLVWGLLEAAPRTPAPVARLVPSREGVAIAVRF